MLEQDAAAVETTGGGEGDASSWPQRVVGGPLNSADLAAVALRLAFGLILFAQGMSKVVSWSFFGPKQSTRELADGFITLIGYDHAYFLSCVLTATELVGGALLVLGLLTSLGAAAYIGIMFQFVSLQWASGMFGNAEAPGFSQNLGMLCVGAAIAYLGPGHLSLDGAFRLQLRGLRWGTAALVVGLTVGAIVVGFFGPGLFAAPPPPPGP